MDLLQTAAKAYEQLCRHTYQFSFDNGQSILVRFYPKHFAHLAGIRKFSDLREFQLENGRPVFSANQLFKKSLLGEFSDYYLQSSTAYSLEAKDRIEGLGRICDLINAKYAVYDFNKDILPFVCKLKSTIFIFNDETYNFYLMLGLAEDGKFYYPETFFLHFDDAYIHGQKIVRIVDIRILEP